MRLLPVSHGRTGVAELGVVESEAVEGYWFEEESKWRLCVLVTRGGEE